MTDEEKSKNYFEASKDYYDSREPITDRKLRQIYLDGLAEGRKELAKENAELKKQIKIDEEIIIGEQQEINELQKKIEKMKNVGNCLHFTDCKKINDKEFILGKIVTCKNCKKWELAE